MLIEQIFPDKLLFPQRFIKVSQALTSSISRNGILVPLIMCENLIVDGHQRLLAAKQLGIEDIPVKSVSGIPAFLFAELNQQRPISLAEIAFLIKSVTASHLEKEFFEQIKLTPSPQTLKVINFLADSGFSPEEIESLPQNVWRELGHLSQNLGKISAWLVGLSGTVGEKRLVAGLLRQADRRQKLPDEFTLQNAAEAIEWLNKIVQPRRSSVSEKLSPWLQPGKIPAGISLKADPTFEKPGLDVSFHVTRTRLERFKQAEEIARQIFEEVEEL